jgi:hypothetical protein
MISRSVWEKFPFDETVTNIEDRVWGKEVLDAGYKIIYEPAAAVYHHHGLHHGNSSERSKGVVSILEHLDPQNLNGLPTNMSPGKVNVAAIIPIMGKIAKNSAQLQQFEKAVQDLKNSRFVNSIHCLVEDELLANSVGIKWINRKSIRNEDSLSLNKLMMSALLKIEEHEDFPESVLYVNHDYLNRPQGIFDELIADAQHKGFDTVFPGLVDYGHYWYQNKNNEFKQTDPSLNTRTKRNPLYKALYGLGCLTSSWVLRSGQLVGGKVGILKITNAEYSQRYLNK